MNEDRNPASKKSTTFRKCGTGFNFFTLPRPRYVCHKTPSNSPLPYRVVLTCTSTSWLPSAWGAFGRTIQ